MSSDLKNHVSAIRKAAVDEKGRPLFCCGCAHSASRLVLAATDGDVFPGHPSGERPCCFCVRNPDREDWQRNAEEIKKHYKKNRPPDLRAEVIAAQNKAKDVDYNAYNGRWYDGTKAYKVPMDCYVSSDMNEQIQIWIAKERGKK